MKHKYRPPQRRHYVRSFLFAAGFISVALIVGVTGYRVFNDETWLDALVDASMILGGMGQVSPLTTTGGKLFASFYAIFCGIIFIGTAAVLLAPWIHQLLHRFHSDTSDK